MADQPTGPGPARPQVQLHCDEVVAQGTYSNLVVLSHSENDFVFDFAFQQPSNNQARVRSRIVSSPRHTKRLLLALQANIARYEQRFGVIEISNEAEPVFH